MRVELLGWWMLPCALAGMLLGAAHLAGAQERPPDGQGRDRPDSSKIEEITITAEKRETLLQNTPVAVSAFTDEMLQRAGINDIEQLSFLVPNLHFGESLGVANITIRGVGTLGGDQATSFHIDGNYQNNPIIPGGLTFFDTQESIGFLEDWSLILGFRWNRDWKRGIEQDSQIDFTLPPRSLQ